jgi:hypothetical protein
VSKKLKRGQTKYSSLVRFVVMETIQLGSNFRFYIGIVFTSIYYFSGSEYLIDSKSSLTMVVS